MNGIVLAAAGTIAAIGLLARSRRNSKPRSLDISNPRPVASSVNGYGFQATPEQIQEDEETHQLELQILEAKIVRSGYFRPDKVQSLIALLHAEYRHFGRVSMPASLSTGEVLGIDEKRELGLRTRHKYTRTMVDYFEPSCLRNIEPKAVINEMRIGAHHAAHRVFQLRKFRALGFIQKVEISGCKDGADCAAIRTARKVYSIDSVPELPLPACNVGLCRCWYIPIIDRPSKRQKTP